MSNVIGNPIATVLPVAAQALDTPASPTTASGTAGPVATATPKPDPCAAGRCKPPGKSQECLLVQKVYSFRSFSNLTYLPVDVRPYFAARFPDLYKADKFPASIQNASDFLNLYGNEPWSLWSQGFESFNLLQAGCAMPRQRWYMTWTLVDIYSFFQAANDPCSAGGPALNVCAATFDERATAAQLDFSNSTFCNGPKEYQDTEQKYLTTLKTHPFRSTASDCVSGNVIEGDLGKCGYYTESGACFMRSSCPNLNVNVSSQCPMYITNFQNSYDPASTVPGTGTTSSSKTVAIVIGVGVAAVVVGLLMALMYSRRRSTDVQLKNTVTLARPGAPPAPTAPSAPVQLQQQQQPLLQQQQQQQQQQPAYPPAAAMQYQQQQPSGYSPVPQGYPATPVSQGYAMSPQGYAPPPGTQGYAAPPPQGYPMPQAQPVYAAAQATGQQQF